MDEQMKALEDEAIRTSLANPNNKISEQETRQAFEVVQSLRTVSYVAFLAEVIKNNEAAIEKGHGEQHGRS